jgi:hypothetical protein
MTGKKKFQGFRASGFRVSGVLRVKTIASAPLRFPLTQNTCDHFTTTPQVVPKKAIIFSQP